MARTSASPKISRQLRYLIETTFDFDMGIFLQETKGLDRKKVLVFRGDGPYKNDTDIPDNEIVKVTFPLEEGETYPRFMHAKFAFSCFEGEGGQIAYRLEIGSKNICAYDNIEAGVTFIGKQTDQSKPGNEPLLRLLQSLEPCLQEGIADVEAKRALLKEAIKDIPSLHFRVEEREAAIQNTLIGVPSFVFHGPHCSNLPLFKNQYDELLIVSPFISPDALAQIKKQLPPDSRCTIFTNPSTVESLLHDGLLSERYLFLNTDRFIHAKLYLARKGEKFVLYLGSMNLTDYAINKNLELMVEFPNVPGIKSVSDFLSSFLELDPEEVEDALRELEPHEGEDFLSQATNYALRRDYYLQLHQNERLRGDDDLEALRYLLSKNCVKNVENLLKSPYFPLIPTQKTAVTNGKERTFYSLPHRDQWDLGLINFAMHHYDHLFSPNVYLHVQGRGPKDAFLKIRNEKGFSSYYILRTDIHAFDPSMQEEWMIRSVKEAYGFDESLSSFLCRYITAKDYRKEGDESVYHDGPAQWTGMALAGVMENVYLKDLDQDIESKCPFYVRVGDDILVGCKTKESAEQTLHAIEEALEKRGLALSKEKTLIASPSEAVPFLGYQIEGGEIDLSPAFLKRAKQGIFQQRKTLLRYYSKKKVPSVLRLPSLIRYIERFMDQYEVENHFKVITTTKSLKVLDDMILDLIRIVATGKKGKDRFRLSLDTIRLFGYRSLVNSYYRFINRNMGEDKRG